MNIVNLLLLDIKPFLACNLACSFCHEHAKRVQFGEKIYNITPKLLRSRFDQYLRCINQTLNTYSSINKIDCSMMGGELFQNRFDQSIFDEYAAFLKSFTSLGIATQISLTTNLLCNDATLQALIALAKQFNISITASFDLYGRYSLAKQVDLFAKNCHTLRSAGIEPLISTVLHKKNIECIQEQRGFYPQFKKLYDENFKIVTVQYYNNASKELYVNQQLLIDTYKYFIKHYPKLHEIKQLLSRHKNAIAVDRAIVKTVSMSCIQDTVKVKDLTDQLQSFADSHCISCKYYNCCYTGGAVYKKDAISQYAIECIDKILFEYIDDQHKKLEL